VVFLGWYYSTAEVPAWLQQFASTVRQYLSQWGMQIDNSRVVFVTVWGVAWLCLPFWWTFLNASIFVDYRRPHTLHRWPRWRLNDAGIVCRVTGWHLTFARVRLARFLAHIVTLALLAFVGWYYWGWKNSPPDFVRININWVCQQFKYYPDFEHRKWIYIGLYVCCWFLFRLWRWIIAVFFGLLLVRRSTVTFTIEQIILPRTMSGRRRIKRETRDQPRFVLLADPRMSVQKNRSPAESALLNQTRLLCLEIGPVILPAANFANPAAADQFQQACEYTLRYDFKDAAAKGVPGTAHLQDDENV